ncbi:MAG: TIGR00730 family Rossman fold protein [Pseudomonadota bacterium]
MTAWDSRPAVCVFCGASDGADPAFKNAAVEVGRALAEAELRLVYGGGSIGLMGAVASSAMKHGGHVTGVMPRFLEKVERPSLNITQSILTDDMHERKMGMWGRADGFLVLPGGVGTLEELVEQITWVQLKQHNKPIVMLNTLGYWDPLEKLFQHMRGHGFIRGEYEIHYHMTGDVSDAIEYLQMHWPDQLAAQR